MGGIVSPNIVNDGLIFYIDAANKQSYPGSGTTAYNLMDANTGTLTNGAGFSSENKGIFDFDGTDDYIELGDLDLLNFERTDKFSVSAWVNSDSWAQPVGTYNSIITKLDAMGGSGTRRRGWFFTSIGTSTSSSISFELWSELGSRVGKQSDYILYTDTWYNLTGTYDGSSDLSGITLYVNGDVLTSTNERFDDLSSTIDSSGISAQIGDFWDLDRHWNGKIPIVQVHNKELSASEVLQNYNALKDRYV